jgi:integrase
LKRARYQAGSLTIRKRKAGSVWVWRWREHLANGGRVHRSSIVGTLADYPTASAARKAIDPRRRSINRQSGISLTVGALVEHYRDKELPEERSEQKAHSTKQCYRSILETWILPHWQSHRLTEVRTVEVEEWLHSLPRSRGTRAKIRGVMHALFNHALRYEWLDRNPISLVRQSGKRERTPAILEIEEAYALLGELKSREHVMVLIDLGTGLRVSELLGLQWQDLDFEGLEFRITRSIVDQVVGNCKTEASRKPMPMHSAMAEALWLWKEASLYTRPEDWVFASPFTHGRLPFHPDSLLQRQIRPAARRVGIVKRIGWHTFRHTFSTWLKANGEDVKTVQELLRHANPRTTLEDYTQAVSSLKRKAQKKVMTMVLGAKQRRRA